MGGTIRDFDGITGRIYGILGSYPPGVGVGVNLQVWVVTWDDGCTIHTMTLPGFVLAVGLLAIGSYRIYRRRHTTLSDRHRDYTRRLSRWPLTGEAPYPSRDTSS